MTPAILSDIDIAYLERQLLNEQGLLKVMPAEFYSKIPQKHLAVFCHHKGIYCLPTEELIEWLRLHIIPGKTIEIGSGVGTVGRALGIPTTDSCYMRDNSFVRAYYTMFGQPITEYPADIEPLDALSAVDKYKPSVVIGCWITHKYDPNRAELGGNEFGIDEETLYQKVNKYIMVGNEHVHRLKPLFLEPYQMYHFDWLYSRAMNGSPNAIYVWERK